MKLEEIIDLSFTIHNKNIMISNRGESNEIFDSIDDIPLNIIDKFHTLYSVKFELKYDMDISNPTISIITFKLEGLSYSKEYDFYEINNDIIRNILKMMISFNVSELNIPAIFNEM